MINAEPDYKMLYEQSQKRLEAVEIKAQKQLEKALQEATQQITEKITREYEQKLHLALLEANALRARLFGIKADSRVKRASEDQLELFTLGASPQALKASEEQLRQEVKEEDKKQEISAEKRKRAPALQPGWYCQRTWSVK
jgi:hypothetical protein